jgi:hypothetical protein
MQGVRSMRRSVVLWALATVVPPAWAQGRPDTQTLLAAQREAMQALARMDGVWRGEASTTLPNGQVHRITQTERIGPMLSGTVKVIEGRGYDAEGKVAFNAFGIVSYDPAKRAYSFHSHAQGLSGDFSFQATADGYSWEIPAGPMLIRYTATIKDGQLHEVGDRIAAGREPVRFFEMTLRRLGDTDWPAAGAVPPR